MKQKHTKNNGYENHKKERAKGRYGGGKMLDRMSLSGWHCVDGVGRIYGPTSQPDATLDDFKWRVGGAAKSLQRRVKSENPR